MTIILIMSQKLTYYRCLNVIGTVALFLAAASLFAENGHRRGNSYDEQFYYFFGLIGTTFSCLPLFLSFRLARFDNYYRYFLSCTLSYFLFYSISVYGLSQIRDVQMYLSHATLHKEISEFKPSELLWTFFGYAPGYKLIVGWTLLIGSTTLCFRTTRLLGAIVMSVLLSNIVLLNYYFEVSLLNQSSVFLIACLWIIADQAPRLWSFFFRNEVAHPKNYPLFPEGGKAYQTLNLLKAMFVFGVLVFYGWKQDRILQWTKNNNQKPIEGTWNIVNYELDTKEIKNLNNDFLKADMFVFERGYWGYVIEEDTMSRFKYLLDTSNHQFELYDFHNYRSLDLKGRYEVIDPETMRFVGKNNRDTLSITLKRNDKYHLPNRPKKDLGSN